MGHELTVDKIKREWSDIRKIDDNKHLKVKWFSKHKAFIVFCGYKVF